MPQSPTRIVGSEPDEPQKSPSPLQQREALNSADPSFVWVAKRRLEEHFEVDLRCWRRFTLRDEVALEEAYQNGIHKDIPVEQGRYTVNLETMTLRCVYWEEPDWPVMRSSWFWRPDHGTDLGIEIINNSWTNTDATPTALPPLPVEPYLCPFGPSDCALLEGALEEIREDLESGPIDCELEDTPQHSNSIVQFTVKKLNNKSASSNASPSPSPKEANPDDVIEYALYNTASKFKLKVYRGYPVKEEPPPDEDIPKDSPVWLCFLIHGIGEMLYNRRHVPTVGAPRCRSHCWRYRHLFGQKLREGYMTDTPAGVPARIEVIPIEWGLSVHDSALDTRLESVTLTSCGAVRTFANLAISDAFLYSQPTRRETILKYVATKMQEKYHLFCTNNPGFHEDVLSGRSAVCILGHSLGSVVAFDLLSRQLLVEPPEDASIDTSIATAKEPSTPAPGSSSPAADEEFQLPFCPRVLFLLGSPLGLFLTIRSEVMPTGALPTCRRVFNIFHPNDCVAYRLEPLVAPELNGIPPMYIPHRGGHRLHVAVRRLHSDVGSAFSSVGSTISSWFGQPTQEQVAEQHRKSKIESALKDSIPSVKLNQGRRIDWVIQESVTEAASELWSAFGSHFSYWRHEDVVSFVVAQLVWCDKDDKQWRDKKDNFF